MNVFVPMASIMIGFGLAERVYGLRPTAVVREVVSTHPALTEWDLRKKGWREMRGRIWTHGNEVMCVYTSPRPMPTISALRWTYDGVNLQCLDPDHANELRIDDFDLEFLKMCLEEEDGWLLIDPIWLKSLVELKRALPLPEGVDSTKIDSLYAKIVVATTHQG